MTLAHSVKLALLLLAQLMGNAVIYILVASEAGEFGEKHLGTQPTFESGEQMLIEMIAVLSGLVVAWCLGGLRTVRGVLLGTVAVVVCAALLPLLW